jgi:hypothetical protein
VELENWGGKRLGGWKLGGLGIKMALKILFLLKSTLYNPVGVDARVVPRATGCACGY